MTRSHFVCFDESGLNQPFSLLRMMWPESHISSTPSGNELYAPLQSGLNLYIRGWDCRVNRPICWFRATNHRHYDYTGSWCDHFDSG